MAELRKQGANLLSQSLFPSKGHFKQALSFADLGVKVEFILMEMVANLFWSSYFEIIVFGLCFILFLIDSNELGAIWFFSPHLLRGYLGLKIMHALPRTHHIIKNASIPPDEKLSFDRIFELLAISAREALDHFTSMTKKALMVYFSLTLICAIIDLILLLSSIRNFRGGKSPYADTCLFAASVSMLALDLFYLVWVNSLSQRVPAYLSSGFL